MVSQGVVCTVGYQNRNPNFNQQNTLARIFVNSPHSSETQEIHVCLNTATRIEVIQQVYQLNHLYEATGSTVPLDAPLRPYEFFRQTPPPLSERYRVLYNGQELALDQTLASYGIEPDSTLHILGAWMPLAD